MQGVLPQLAGQLVKIDHAARHQHLLHGNRHTGCPHHFQAEASDRVFHIAGYLPRSRIRDRIRQIDQLAADQRIKRDLSLIHI